MTDRLSAHLHREADALDVPPPPAGPVLAQGRSLRRRRRLTTLAGAAAAVLVIVGGGAVVLGGDDPAKTTPTDVIDAPADAGVTFAVGTTVYYGDATAQVTIDDKAVKSLHYTSAGVLVHHGDNAYAHENSGPQRFSLVRLDGTVSTVSVATEETRLTTDPDQPLLVYAQNTGGMVEVVVHDVETDTEVSRVPVPGAEGRSSSLPVALSGDLVYLGTRRADFVVDWRSGEVSQPGIVQGYPVVSGGRFVEERDDGAAVLDAETGEELLTVPFSPPGEVRLSPDGRFALLDTWERVNDFDVYDVESGSRITISDTAARYGWTADGDLFRVTEEGFTTCDAGTGDCSSTAMDLAGSLEGLQLGGRTWNPGQEI